MLYYNKSSDEIAYFCIFSMWNIIWFAMPFLLVVSLSFCLNTVRIAVKVNIFLVISVNICVGLSYYFQINFKTDKNVLGFMVLSFEVKVERYRIRWLIYYNFRSYLHIIRVGKKNMYSMPHSIDKCIFIINSIIYLYLASICCLTITIFAIKL